MLLQDSKSKSRTDDGGSKFNDVHRKWVSNHQSEPNTNNKAIDQTDFKTFISGSTPVKKLTGKFDPKDATDEDEELKLVVTEQRVEIEKLKTEVQSKERRIAELEATIKAMNLRVINKDEDDDRQ